MYYLDFFSLHKPTTAEERKKVRLELDQNFRDDMMVYRLHLQKDKCFYCGIRIFMDDHLDHLIPVMYGGYNSRANLVAACKACNRIKGTGHIEITNERTINDYLRLQAAYKKWQVDVLTKPKLKRWQPKRVQLYGVYHAELFKEL